MKAFFQSFFSLLLSFFLLLTGFLQGGQSDKPEPTAPATEPTKPTTEPATEPTTVPAAPTGEVHGARCFCYTYTGNGLLVNIVRFICAVYNFLWNLRGAVKY